MNKSCKDKSFIVYCHTNNINGKKYIGITSQTPEQRFRHGKGYKKSKYFNRAIQKYGWDNFTHEILYKDLTIEDAKEKEIELIKLFNTRDNDKGYNILAGGDLIAGEYSPLYNTHLSEETKRKMSDVRKGVPKPDGFGEKISNKLKGRIFSEETRKKMSLHHADFKGKNHSKSKRVLCLETGLIYESVGEASRATGCNRVKISNVCNGYRDQTGGLHFKFANDEKF